MQIGSQTEMAKTLKFEFPELDGNKRLRELVLYVSHKCSNDPTFGATKLNKILFYSDFWSFFRFGEPIAGLRYRNFQTVLRLNTFSLSGTR